MLSIVDAAADGDRLGELRALRLILARSVNSDETPARDLASLSRRLMEVGREVEELEAISSQEGGDGGVVPDQEFDPSAL
ncbi:MAG: hypothetical protein IPJ61_17670 [Tessaracoccus sp.]|uniref:hypothetical protein n=1 Tax=Tessaracoccus sp. TaxID=1971211 RepID=UPI001ED28D3C|nr:hypothetical protein [Tessaracoccus sp.]MBK7822834.1 hypothetical protein [Tessaracoccus sp.]